MSTIQKPDNEQERFVFCSELIQYRVFHLIDQLRHDTRFIGLGRAAINKTMKLSKIQDYSGTTLLNIVAVNRFSNSDEERLYWTNAHISLPQNVSVSFINTEPDVDNRVRA